MKRILRLLLPLVFILSAPALPAQDRDMFRQKKERKKLWKRWRKNRQSYNPYLDRKAKDKPSAQLRRENAKGIRQQQREAKKQMKRNNRELKRSNRKKLRR